MASFDFINDFIDTLTDIFINLFINAICVVVCSSILLIVLYLLAKYAHVPYVGNFVLLILVPKSKLLWILTVYIVFASFFTSFFKKKLWYKKYHIQYFVYSGFGIIISVLTGFGCAMNDCVP